MKWIFNLRQYLGQRYVALSEPRNLLWAIVFLLVALLIIAKLVLRLVAYRTIGRFKAIYGDKHQFIQVRANEFPFLDQRFYDVTRNWLMSQRFVHAGDLEDITMTRRFPGTDTFYRVMLGDGGATAGIFWHLKVRRRWKRFKRRMLNLPNDERIVEFSTELEDGTFIITTNCPAKCGYGEIPGFLYAFARPESLLNEILELHREKVFQVLGARRTRTRPRMNIDAMINSLHREQISRAEFRAKAGFVDTQELRTLNGKKRGFFAGLLAGEIDRVQRAQGFKVPKAAIPADFAEEMDEVEDLEKLTETAVPLAPVAEKNAAQLQEEALKIFENEEEVDDNGDMSLRWERFCTALKAAVDSTGVEHDALIAMSMDGSEIGIGRMHGVKPYLCFNRPDDSASLENFRDYFLEGTMYDPPFSRIGAIIVGLDHNHLLYVLLEFLEENTEQAKFTLTFDSDWDKPTVLYLESDIDGGQAKPYDARKAL